VRGFSEPASPELVFPTKPGAERRRSRNPRTCEPRTCGPVGDIAIALRKRNCYSDRLMAHAEGWLLLVHQLPPKPLYLRAQVRRRLAQVGALPLKNSVYVLPDRNDCLEDLQWIAQEAAAGGGEACVCRVEFIDGVSPAELKARFQAATDERLTAHKVLLAQRLAQVRRRKTVSSAGTDPLRLQRQVDEALRTDFFASDVGTEVRTLMTAIKSAIAQSARKAQPPAKPASSLKGRVWVTRRDPHIDRLATAWLIRRFVDPAARFRFVDRSGGPARPEERSFDMTGADFTHEGDRCSFETMCARLGLTDPALRELAEIVHDLDLKDNKFGRADAAGVQRLVDGLSASYPDSGTRTIAALPLFDALFASFGGRLPKPGARQPKRDVTRRKGRASR
jgi:hypothetical protein